MFNNNNQSNNKDSNKDTIQPIKEDTGIEPDKTNPYYYFRPWKTILLRTVADGGKSFYFCGDHKDTVKTLGDILITMDEV